MFQNLTTKLGEVFDRLRRRGALSEADVTEALRAVRVALLEADVALPVVKDFIEAVRVRAVGQDVLRSVTPGQMVVKIVHDHLVEVLGSTAAAIDLKTSPPAPILMVGLQGSGKTTSTAKIARRLKTRERKKVLMASLDVARPAAQHQLEVLGQQSDIATLPIVPGEPPLAIARRAMTTARLEGYDVVILDTAGRLHVDDALMDEVAAVRDAVKPVETLLVADAMTGQDAVVVAKSFAERIGITGIVLTRVDGDARGGAALSMRAVTGQPIKLIGTGEKLDALEDFHPDRIAGRILGMGDVVGLVEKAAETIEREDAEKLAAKMQAGIFDLDDMASQLRQLRKMGGMGGVMGMLPGIGKIKQQMAGANIDDRMIRQQEAIISSMTRRERRNVALLNASRRKRIAAGSGTTVQLVNRLIKQYQDMSRMMKQVQKLGKGGLLRSGLKGLMGGGPGPGFGGPGFGGPGFGGGLR
ncbi:MAG: signal recognition particle protein [Alphaproteobacteria bacterium]|nr:signal recognition particle protein [Alphaproteobacteria bacterium]